MSDRTLVMLFRGSTITHQPGWPWPTACKAGLVTDTKKVRVIDEELLDGGQVRRCRKPACAVLFRSVDAALGVSDD